MTLTGIFIVILVQTGYCATDKYNMPADEMEAMGYYQGGSGNAAVLEDAAIFKTVDAHIKRQTRDRGFFLVNDPALGRDRRVSVVSMDKKPKKEGDRYYVRSIVRDMDNNEILAVDTYVQKKHDKWEVVGQLIKKQAGRARTSAEIGELPEGS